MKAYNFRKAQEWWMSDDRKADKRTNRSFKRSERFAARKAAKKHINGEEYEKQLKDEEAEYRIRKAKEEEEC